MKKEFFAIGHLTNDLEPTPHVGGGVAYSSLAAHRLGFNAHIITKCPPDHPYLNELKALGITVHRLPTRNSTLDGNITSFRNTYDNHGKRMQIVTQLQEKISPEDLGNFPSIPKGAVTLVAPVIGEVSTQLFPKLSETGYLTVTPQGYFRRLGDNGVVQRQAQQDLAFFSYAQIAILSEEDITFNNEAEMAESLLQQLKDASNIVVLTQGENGSTVFQKGGQELHAASFRLGQDELVDPTGAGDTYAAAFIARYIRTENVKEASAFANIFAALKISGIEGKKLGVTTVPRNESVWQAINSHPERFRQFLKENELYSLQFDYEGSQRFKEMR